jgi:hypothetical protein
VGLIHPVDLDAYRRDEARRQSFSRLRRIRTRLRGADGPGALTLRVFGPEPDVLVAFDSTTLSCRAAVLGVLDHLDVERVAILAPFPLDVPGAGLASGRVPDRHVATVGELTDAVPDVAVVLSAGAHAPAGALGHELTTRTGATSIVVQHGMLLPQAAPLPSGVTLAAWSDADGTYWRSGRDDVEVRVVGSELLRRALGAVTAPVPLEATPVYCGALHGTELPRWEIERVARSFCRATGARYRPHPREIDLQSRLTHLVWRRLGIRFDPADRPLLEVGAPVVSMWSTAVLEAAAAGLPAWVYHPDPPAWLTEVWSRYGLAEWGADPTPVPTIAQGAPAERLAGLVEESAR